MLKQLWCLVTRGPVLNPWTEHSAVSCSAVRDSNSDDGDLDRTVYYSEPSSWSILLKTEDSPAWCHSSPSVKAQPPQVTWKFCKNILFFLQKKKAKLKSQFSRVLSSFDFPFCGDWCTCCNFLFRDLLKASVCPNLLSNNWEESCLDPAVHMIHTFHSSETACSL